MKDIDRGTHYKDSKVVVTPQDIQTMKSHILAFINKRGAQVIADDLNGGQNLYFKMSSKGMLEILYKPNSK